MLQDSDRIFRDLYGLQDWRLEGARKRGLGTILQRGKGLEEPVKVNRGYSVARGISTGGFHRPL